MSLSTEEARSQLRKLPAEDLKELLRVAVLYEETGRTQDLIWNLTRSFGHGFTATGIIQLLREDAARRWLEET